MTSSLPPAESSPKRWGIPLRWALIIPFALQVLAAVGLVGYQSLQNGQAAIEVTALQLQSEIMQRIEQKLADYLEIPHIINHINAEVIYQGALKTQDQASERYLWRQIQRLPAITWIYYGDQASGDFLGVTRTLNQNLQLVISDASTRYLSTNYTLTVDGQRDQRVKVTPNPYDPRPRPWYQQAVQQGEAVWTDVYADFDFPQLIMSAALPVYDAAGQLLGVCGVDYSLHDISRFLRQLQIGRTGQAYIVDQTGTLIAISSGEAPYQVREDQTLTRLTPAQSTSTLIQKTASWLQDGARAPLNPDSLVTLNHQSYFIQTQDFQDPRGLNWTIVTIIPETDFLEQFHHNWQTTLLLCLLALLGSLGVGWMTSRWIIRPIQTLIHASHQISKGQLHQQIQVNRIAELEELGQSFNSMSTQVNESVTNLEAQVKKRTQEVVKQAKSRGLVNRILRSFLAQEGEQAIQLALESLVRLFPAVDRAYIFKYNAQKTETFNTHEWCANGIPAQINRYKKVPVKAYPWLHEQMFQGNVVAVNDLKTLRDKASLELATWQQQSIQSIVYVPLSYRDQLLGTLGVEVIRSKTYQWTPQTIQVLRLVGEIIAMGQARSSAEMALQKSEAQLRMTLEAANMGAWEWDIETGEERWSPEMQYLLGQVDVPVTGFDEFLQCVHPEDRNQLLAAQDQALREGTRYQSEYRVILPDGQLRWLTSIGSFQRDATGKAIKLSGISLDITERKCFEADLQKAKEAAEQANRAKSTFLANMSHELRTPLNGILGFAQLLARDAALNPQQKRSIDIINTSGEHLLALINDILDVSKIEAGRVVLQNSLVDLHALVEAIHDLFLAKVEAKGLDFQVEVDASVPYAVMIDEGKLRQILVNLLSNALKFTYTGSIYLQVQAQSTTLDQVQLTLVVQDTGEGIQASDLKKLFKAFSQTESGLKQQSGTGLGLTISRNFARMMGGDIQVMSQPGQGSTFTVTLQAEIADPELLQPEPPSCRVRQLAPGQPEYRLLIVDDKLENRELLDQLLSSIGFVTRLAANGQEALEIWASWEPHLVWMDMRMPIMDGYEATRRIKATDRGKTVPVIAITASAFDHERDDVLAAGCDDFVSKPFRQDTIFTKLIEHLGVCYEYDDPLELAEPEVGDISPSLLAATMPKAWIQDLYQAATLARDTLILSLLDQIPEVHTTLRLGLVEWVDNFQFDLIIETCSQALDL